MESIATPLEFQNINITDTTTIFNLPVIQATGKSVKMYKVNLSGNDSVLKKCYAEAENNMKDEQTSENYCIENPDICPGGIEKFDEKTK